MIKQIVKLCKKFFYSPEKYIRDLGVKVGSNCSIASILVGTEPYLIEIGDHVQITNGVRIFTHGACWVFRNEFPKMDFFGKVKIGNNVYVGNCAMIMPGVTIGDNVIVGAGSVVTKSVKSGSIVAGNPARVVGNVSDFYSKIKEFDLSTKGLNYEKKKKVLLSSNENSFISK